MSHLRIALLGHWRYGLSEPYAGGLEAHTAMTARSLQRSGHTVTVYAGSPNARQPGDLDVRPMLASDDDYSAGDRSDNVIPAGRHQAHDVAHRSVMSDVLEPGRYDIVHNNSLHYLPPLLCSTASTPMIHVLHCPPFDNLSRAHTHRTAQAGSRRKNVVAVSESLRRQWSPLADRVVLNGVDVERWTPNLGPTSDRCAWAGRIVPEKAPHLALDAARIAGRDIVIAGPVQHQGYFDAEIAPRLGPRAEWVGHLDHDGLNALHATSAVGLVTPCWSEPFGLVAAEMLACGTPVAAFRRGGLREVVDGEAGRFARACTAEALADVIDEVSAIDRSVCRRRAEEVLSVDRMVAEYLDLYRESLQAGAP
jgi:glycosyltransferase involved in cell wall biosynthesis